MAYRLPKLPVYIPLWKQAIPKYPLYWKGDPQLRIFLPLFWMRVVKPRDKAPPNCAVFEVHPQMTKVDIKNYLEKIYDIPVHSVKSATTRGEKVKDEKGSILRVETHKRFAFVELAEGTWEFPELFKERKPQESKVAEQFAEQKHKIQHEQQKSWGRADIPSWFR